MTNYETKTNYNVLTRQEVRHKFLTYNLYVDVLFLVNFIMDYMVLALLGVVLKVHATAKRRILGSGAGALWAVMITAFPILPGWLEALITYLGISTLMVFLTFQFRSVRELIKGVCGLYLAAITVGGVIYALYYNTRAGYYVELLIRGQAAGAIPLSIWVLLIAGTYFGTKYLWLILLEARKRKNHFYQVTLYYRGRTELVTALLDTGNHLYEPVSKKPVHVITYDACKYLCESISAVVYIPYHSLGKKDGVIPGVFLDAMEINQDGRIKRIEKPLVAVSKEPLSPGGEYQMLLHEES